MPREPIGYSQAGQDVFVLAMLHGPQAGTFADIGCERPFEISNSLLLEERGWRGIALDIDDYREAWAARETPFIQADALNCDFAALFAEHGLASPIDYLSLDVALKGERLTALENVLASGFEFKVITMEHDAFKPGFDEAERQPQRALLTSLGYELVCADVHAGNGLAFEDWWAHPGHVPASRSGTYRCDYKGHREIFSTAGVDLDAVYAAISRHA